MLITIIMKAVPAKKHELMHTLDELQPFIRKQKGCLSVSVCTRPDNGHVFIMNKKWVSPEAFLGFINSEPFQVLLGAIKILTHSSELSVSMNAKAESMAIVLPAKPHEIDEWMRTILFNDQTAMGDPIPLETSVKVE